MDEGRALDPALSAAHRAEIQGGRRFGFGRNWRAFAADVDQGAIGHAEGGLLDLLEPAGVLVDARLDGLRLLDAGCGSGLSSLAALRRGAIVTAFDLDPDSIIATDSLIASATTAEERDRFTLLHGSVLDGTFVGGLGTFDVVYSWGVLHHTGAMWDACRTVARAVRPGGVLALALYHDAGVASRVWWYVKRSVVALPHRLQVVAAAALLVPIELFALVRSLLRADPVGYVRRWTGYRGRRGMTRWRDHLDWVGGFPYEWASPHEVVARLSDEGFEHVATFDAIAWGCNQFIFRRAS